MASEWKAATVGEIAESVSITHSFHKEELIFLNTSDILLGKILHHSYSPVRTWPGQAKKSIQKHDILFSEIRPANGRYAYVDTHGEDFVVSTKLMVIRVRNTRQVLPKFLYHYITSERITGRLQGLAESRSGTFPQITFDQLADVEIPLPAIADQAQIARFLDQIGEKIDLLQRMNGTLEAMARAIFKSWFVDFDPVRAKAAGRQPFGMNAETAALFPSSFQDSPLGKIPKGWHPGSIYQLADVHYGAPYASGQFNATRQGKPLIRIRDLATHDPEVFTTEDHPRAIDIEPGDIIVGMDGEFRVHHWRGPSAVLNQRLCSFRPKHDIPPVYVSEVIREPLSFVERSETATTVIHLGKVDIDSFVVLLPPHKLLHSFAASTQILVDRIVHSAQESRTLTAIRDTLLPKLISGEVRLKDAEKVFGERV